MKFIRVPSRRSIFIIIFTCFLLSIIELITFTFLKLTHRMPSQNFSEIYNRDELELTNSPWRQILSKNNYNPVFKSQPYWGFSYNNKIDSKGKINFYGFPTYTELPYRKKNNEFVIALLGGSAASMIGEQINLQKDFEEKIHKALPFLSTKKIVFLNLAIPVFKQPQQFFVATYFAETFDLVINYEGYNEATMGHFSSWPTEYPQNIQLEGEIAEFDIKAQTSIKYYTHAEDFLSKLYRYIPFSQYSNTYYTLWLTLKGWIATKYRDISLERNNIKNFGNYVHPTDNSIAQEVKERTAIWTKYLILEKTMLNKLKIPSVFILQPYLMTKTKLSETEKQIPLKTHNNHIKQLELFYLKANDIKQELNKEGIILTDMRDVFSNTSEEVYTDFCHYTETGASIVIDQIVKTLSVDQYKYVIQKRVKQN